MQSGRWIKRSLKVLLLLFLCAIGNLRPRKGWPVLLYHSVDDDTGLATPPWVFDCHMRYLKEHGYQVVSLTGLISAMEGNEEGPQRAVALTFDDGCRGVWAHAFPILQRYGFTATVFVVTDYIGKESVWYRQDQLSPQPLVSWEEISRLHQAGIEVAPHTCTHPHLPRLSEKEIEAEVRSCKEVLEERLGQPGRVFAYPFGDYDERVRWAVKQAGYGYAVSTRPGLFCRGDDPFTMKRLCLDFIRMETPLIARLALKACLTGTFAWYISAKQAFGRRRGN